MASIPQNPTEPQELNPFSRWGIALSEREGLLTVTETTLWWLELKHPEAVERDGDEIYLYLDRPYRAVPQQDRSFLKLLPAPYRERKQKAAAPAVQAPPASAS
ncbi:MAG: hypothetical protein HZB56_02495 [Deltaproteobacteria bacterium]|nr:hypothetical protein [Deltaproteobacteria bacterium]